MQCVKSYWPWLAALLIPLLYLPMLASRFDFIDDGNLVYAAPAMPLAQRVEFGWSKVVANYQHLGPFRPTLWAHWEVWADALRGNEFAWRLTRLVWCAGATLLLFALLRNLNIAPVAALFVTALSMWNPYRNEFWISLTLSEGVAMPYALLALLAARRAPLSQRAWMWDTLGIVCVLMAIGCKNVFMVLVPAQCFLRCVPDGVTVRAGIAKYWRRALVLSLTLIWPVAHYIYFKLNWHAGQYVTPGPSVRGFLNQLLSLVGAISLPFLAGGLVLTVVSLVKDEKKQGVPATAESPWTRYRAAIVTGAILLLGGVTIYSPLGAISGRYAIPAVWGIDIALAILLSQLLLVRATLCRRAAWAALLVGLTATAVSHVGKQQKFMARADMLWNALEWVEHYAPPNATVAWISGTNPQQSLDASEGIHFQWHLERRSRSDIHVVVLEPGQPCPVNVQLAVWGPAQTDNAAPMQLCAGFVSDYWVGLRRYECKLGKPRDGLAQAP